MTMFAMKPLTVDMPFFFSDPERRHKDALAVDGAINERSVMATLVGYASRMADDGASYDEIVSDPALRMMFYKYLDLTDWQQAEEYMKFEEWCEIRNHCAKVAERFARG